MITTHTIHFRDAADMADLAPKLVNLVVTSPPYPMIEMWDEQFCASCPEVGQALEAGDGRHAFELMHLCLDRVWSEVDKVLEPSGVVCINMGDATRSVGGTFRLYPNHIRIARFFTERGYDMLPLILWRKTSNKPNKFMGSGMLPPNAYVTLEHEYILIFRKGGNRQFPEDTAIRRQSAYFREERNLWFSDVWLDLKGVPQQLNGGGRNRSAAYPVELPYRLIQMYSVHGDTVLDPFAGTGTTMLAAMASGRNFAGYEIDRTMEPVIDARVDRIKELANLMTTERLERHRQTISRETDNKTEPYTSRQYGFPVKTAQETDIVLPLIENVTRAADGRYQVDYKRNE